MITALGRGPERFRPLPEVTQLTGGRGRIGALACQNPEFRFSPRTHPVTSLNSPGEEGLLGQHRCSLDTGDARAALRGASLEQGPD